MHIVGIAVESFPLLSPFLHDAPRSLISIVMAMRGGPQYTCQLRTIHSSTEGTYLYTIREHRMHALTLKLLYLVFNFCTREMHVVLYLQ